MAQQLFEEPTDVRQGAIKNKKKCKCCLEEKPLDGFYRNSATGVYYGRCKACAGLDRKATKLYLQVVQKEDRLYAEWPDELKELARLFANYRARGGKITYANSYAPLLADVYVSQNPDEFYSDDDDYSNDLDNPRPEDRIAATLTELHDRFDQLNDTANGVTSPLSDLLNLVDDIYRWASSTNKQILALAASGSFGVNTTGRVHNDTAIQQRGDDIFADVPANKKSDYRACFQPSANDLRERDKLVKELHRDPKLNELLDNVDYEDFFEYLHDCFDDMRKIGYIESKHVRTVVATLAFAGYKMGGTFEIIYTRFLKPGLETAQKQENYDAMVEDCISLLNVNAYEVDWHDILTGEVA